MMFFAVLSLWGLVFLGVWLTFNARDEENLLKEALATLVGVILIILGAVRIMQFSEAVLGV